ncbi:CoA transferase [Ochrobactrum sp. BD22]|uniref:CoA transferase n=2 Tax=unclassified Ochrobactrum TaxID=239106 RepID=UPI000DEFDB34|nr:CoA transferase [Ochrobactrum sp. 3-3]MBQ0710400.1 CoA transferase [Ochrobactrum sp. AP1BH01-1]
MRWSSRAAASRMIEGLVQRGTLCTGTYVHHSSLLMGCFGPVPDAVHNILRGSQMPVSPFAGLIVQQKGNALAGRLAAMLLADQGAEVYVCDRSHTETEGLDDFLDRGKTLLPLSEFNNFTGADIVIVDGRVERHDAGIQIHLGFPALASGDTSFDLPDDASDDLLSAMIGFYTDLGITSRLLGSDVIYTPLPLCSVYAAVLSVSAVSAALISRHRTGAGTIINVPRLAAGLSAIGVLAMQLDGVEPHLKSTGLMSLPPAIAAEVPAARADPNLMITLINKLSPANGCYRTLDNRLVTPVTTVNRSLMRQMLEIVGLTDEAGEWGLVDASVYDPANAHLSDHNIALPAALRPDINIRLAGRLAEIFASRTASEWEKLFAAAIPFGTIRTFEEWMALSSVREAGLVITPTGLKKPQIGRAVNIASAKPYPPVHRAKRAIKATAPAKYQVATVERKLESGKPLEGYKVLDLANVIAGPACGRLLGELGADVIKVDATRPNHVPLVTIEWGAEANQGKRSILLDLKMSEGRKVLEQLIASSDIIVMNETDAGVEHLGLTRDAIMRLNPVAIVTQISAFKGEFPAPDDKRPGYDPLLQAVTGIMTRFGSPELPLIHGIASCVDYLTGYLGAFAALAALQARERRADGSGDWAETSLAAAAALTQLPFQWTPAGPTMTGPNATGPSAEARLWQQSDGWIFAETSTSVSAGFRGLSVADAIRHAHKEGGRAVPVTTIAALRTAFLAKPAKTVRFRKTSRNGLHATLLEPTWFEFNGKQLSPSSEPGRPGADADAILSELGLSAEQIAELKASNAIGNTDWLPLTQPIRGKRS